MMDLIIWGSILGTFTCFIHFFIIIGSQIGFIRYPLSLYFLLYYLVL